MTTTINGSAGVTTNTGAIYDGLQRDTAKSATGTSVDFTGIPSWVKRITVMFDGVSTNGTSVIQIQIGDSGGVETSGYAGAVIFTASTAIVTTSYTSGFGLYTPNPSSDVFSGLVTIANLNGNVWASSGGVCATNSRSGYTAGSKTLTATLDRVRITTVNGTDTFDAGSINIIYE